MRLILLLAILAAPALTACERDAQALANPQTTGKNYALVATATPTVINAQGTNCSITLQVDFDPKDGGAHPDLPFCSGYSPTGGPALTRWNCANPLCTDTTKCVSVAVVRDTKPGAVWVVAPNFPDGGTPSVPFRVEMGAGCQGP